MSCGAGRRSQTSPMPRLVSLAPLVIPTGVYGYARDLILPNTRRLTPAVRAPTGRQAPHASDWFDLDAEIVSAGSSCAMPGLAIMPPDSSLAEYEVLDGWCLCSTEPDADEPATWYSFCAPPAHHPSQINLLVVNATAVTGES